MGWHYGAGVIHYYSRAGITLYHGDCREISPTLTEPGHVFLDAPYSAHVHKKATAAGKRSTPMRTGAGLLSPSALARNVDLGFDSLTPDLLAFLAAESARLSPRWTLSFSDVESCHLWRSGLVAAGLDYVRTAAWRKLCATPQFTGDRPAVAFECITIAHPKGRKRWNGHGRHGWWDVPEEADIDDLEAYDGDLVYQHPTVQERGGKDGTYADREPRIHETQKPEKLMCDLVLDFTDPGDLIYDLVCGGATTLVAAWRCERRATGIEKREEICERSAKRIDRAIDRLGYYSPEREAASGQCGLDFGAPKAHP